VLAGEIAAERGKFLDAVGHLDRAVRLEDDMLYNDPPDGYFPVRRDLGAALLAGGRPDEAEVVYWQDLGRNRDNGYALYALTLSLEALGKADQAAAMRRRFEAAWSNADVILTSSRF
jgi:tetratricopeptide (TPR) repeat protein